MPHWRFKLSNYSVSWPDLVLGKREVKLTAVSDPVLIRADGTPLYTFTSVVDDLDMKVSHILRGEDHITNTGVQIDILEALGGSRSKIAFAHFPLLTAGDGAKLSKRTEEHLAAQHARRRHRARRHHRLSRPPRLLRRSRRCCRSTRWPQEFDFDRFSASPAKFDIGQVLALNRKLLHGMAFRRHLRIACPPAPPRRSGSRCAAISTCSPRRAAIGTWWPAASCRRSWRAKAEFLRIRPGPAAAGAVAGRRVDGMDRGDQGGDGPQAAKPCSCPCDWL